MSPDGWMPVATQHMVSLHGRGFRTSSALDLDHWMWTNAACDYVIAQVSLHGSDFRAALLQMMDAPMMMKMLSSFDGVAGVQRPPDDDGHPLERADDKGDDSEPSAPTEVMIGAGRVHEESRLAAEGQLVSWRFSIASDHVQFSVACFLPGDVKERVLEPHRKFAARDGAVSGSCIVPHGAAAASTDAAGFASALVVLRWSNAHSWVRSKTLQIWQIKVGGETVELEDSVEGPSTAGSDAATAP